MSKYEKVTPGELIGDSVLTQQGAAELNSYREGVASGQRPTASEIASATLANILKSKGQKIPDGAVGRALEMERADLKIYPVRKPWTLDRVNDWLAKAGKKKS